MAETSGTQTLDPLPTDPPSSTNDPPPTNTLQPANNPLASTNDTPPPTSDPPKRMISLKRVKSTEPTHTSTNDNYSNNRERKRVFLPETDSKQDFPLSVTLQLSIEQLKEALKYEWKEEKLNSPTRMRDAGTLHIFFLSHYTYNSLVNKNPQRICE
jgi:hypothetical protein